MVQTVERVQVYKVKYVQVVLNGIYTAFKNIIPMELVIEKPKRMQGKLHITYGVLIGTVGDMKGNLVVSGKNDIFNDIAKKMYGVDLDAEMLSSFSCELTNMIAGTLSTIMDMSDIHMDITAPKIMNGDAVLSGYEDAFQLTFLLESGASLDVYFLLDTLQE